MSKENKIGRRDFIRAAAVVAAGGGAWMVTHPGEQAFGWQLDPRKCQQCGRCATACVLSPSAVKCVHAYEMCGYCDLCGGYLQPGAKGQDTGAENELCPVAALKRTFVEAPMYEYTILEDLCIGCGKCVKGCNAFGNGSLQLQVKQEICVRCNECAIARDCPAQAFQRVPIAKSYMLKTLEGGGEAKK
jgi:electron transport complex protein RnfB